MRNVASNTRIPAARSTAVIITLPLNQATAAPLYMAQAKIKTHRQKGIRHLVKPLVKTCDCIRLFACDAIISAASRKPVFNCWTRIRERWIRACMRLKIAASSGPLYVRCPRRHRAEIGGFSDLRRRGHPARTSVRHSRSHPGWMGLNGCRRWKLRDDLPAQTGFGHSTSPHPRFCLPAGAALRVAERTTVPHGRVLSPSPSLARWRHDRGEARRTSVLFAARCPQCITSFRRATLSQLPSTSSFTRLPTYSICT